MDKGNHDAPMASRGFAWMENGCIHPHCRPSPFPVLSSALSPPGSRPPPPSRPKKNDTHHAHRVHPSCRGGRQDLEAGGGHHDETASRDERPRPPHPTVEAAQAGRGHQARQEEGERDQSQVPVVELEGLEEVERQVDLGGGGNHHGEGEGEGGRSEGRTEAWGGGGGGAYLGDADDHAAGDVGEAGQVEILVH
jgi:hypothetical protein